MSKEKEIPMHRERLNLPDKEAVKKVQDEKRKKIMQDMAMTFGTPEGMRSLEIIAKLCGFGKTNVGANPQLGMDVRDGTLYNASREGVYKELRTFLPARILKKVEFGDVIEIN